jgi:hypothetical protein
VSLIRLEADFPETSPLVMYDALHDPDYRKVWDDRMVEGFCIEEIDNYNDVGYYQVRRERERER